MRKGKSPARPTSRAGLVLTASFPRGLPSRDLHPPLVPPLRRERKAEARADPEAEAGAEAASPSRSSGLTTPPSRTIGKPCRSTTTPTPSVGALAAVVVVAAVAF